MNRRLGPIETSILAWAQMRSTVKIEPGQVASALGLSRKQEIETLSRLNRAGVITRLPGGNYLIPPKLPPGGKWSPPESLVLEETMKFYGAKYQLVGPKVFNRYRLSNQIAQQTSLYNDKISGRRTIAGLTYEFIKVPVERLGQVNKSEGALPYPTLGRALMDAIYDWSRFNTLPKAYQWIRDLKKSSQVMKDLVESSIRFGNVSTRRRLGYWLEALKVNPRLVAKLRRGLKETTAVIPLVPGRPTRGAVSRRWGVVINAEI